MSPPPVGVKLSVAFTAPAPTVKVKLVREFELRSIRRISWRLRSAGSVVVVVVVVVLVTTVVVGTNGVTVVVPPPPPPPAATATPPAAATPSRINGSFAPPFFAGADAAGAGVAGATGTGTG